MGHEHTPPAVPEEIRDEAGASPKWLPGLGVLVFALLLVWVLWGAGVFGERHTEHPQLFQGSAQAR